MSSGAHSPALLSASNHLRRRAPILGVALLLLVAVAAYRLPRAASGDDLQSALSAALEEQGVALAADERLVFLVPDKGPLVHRPVIFLGSDGGAADLYFASVRHGDDSVYDVARLTNLTRTAGAAELGLIDSGHYAAYLSESVGGVDALTVLDLRGEPRALTDGWSRVARAQNSITNLQDTGRFAGFGRTRYPLINPAPEATLTASLDGARASFVAELPAGRVELIGGQLAPASGLELVDVTPVEKARPGKITWLVDTVRRVSFIGPEPIAWLEHHVFSAKDRWDRISYRFFGEEITEAEVAEQLGMAPPSAEHRRLSVVDPERGFPPAPLKPVVPSPSEGEGEWMVVVDDPFVGSFPGAPPAFAQTHLRVDPERRFARVFIVVWDPRMLQLRMMSGTREPESATGATGPGMVDRAPATLTRLVGAFNGGFQAMHGEFGAMSDGQVYLPPKPYAATVGIYRDGTVSLGSFLGLPEGAREYSERAANEQIPEGMFEFRQNLTTVVEDGRINPWGRWWWGAAPLNADEQVMVDRSGLCLTEEGFLAYFWGRSMGADQLGEAMLATRCVRGMHLDMNVKHTAFEYYNVRSAETPFEPLGRALEPSEAEGPVYRAPGLISRTRMMARSMEPMRFPRYINRDPRDFFYLLMRPILPGPPLAGRHPAGQGEFTTSGLPHAGWPHAFARAHVGDAQGERVWLVRMDPARVHPKTVPARVPAASHNAPAAATTLAYLTGITSAGEGDFGLYAVPADVGYRYRVGTPPEGAIRILMGAELDAASGANAAIGVDDNGFLVYAERQPRATDTVSNVLRRAGVSHAIALPDDARLALLADGQTISVDEFARPVEVPLSLPLVAETAPASEVLFPEVEPRPYGYWGRIQDTRVRYIREEGHVFRSTQPSPEDE